MGRFDNLEFDDDEGAKSAESAKEPIPAATGTPIRDAAFFLAAAVADFRLDNLEAALRGYSRALEQDSTLYEGWFGQVRVLLATGEYKEADLWADKALELFPDQPELLAVKAIASVRIGKRALALAQSDNALTRKGVTPFVWLARAEILLAARRPMANHYLAKAFEISPEGAAKAWTHWEAARLLRRYDRRGEALKHAREAANLLPAEAAAWLELARCQINLSQPAARQSFEQAAALGPDSPVIQKMLREYREPGFFRRLLRLR